MLTIIKENLISFAMSLKGSSHAKENNIVFVVSVCYCTIYTIICKEV